MPPSKYTPGPWKVYGQVGTANEYHLYDAKDNYPKNLSLGVMQANALLMQAAPDLLEVCKFLLTNYGIPEGKERLQAAITKATKGLEG